MKMSQRFLVGLALVFWGQAALAQEKVTYTTPALFVSEICRDLSEILKGEYSASGVVSDIPLLIHVDGIGKDQLLEEIARAVDGEWRQSGKSWTLSRSRNRDLQIAAESRKLLAGRIKKGLAAKVEEYGKSQWDDASLSKLVAAEAERRQALLDSLRQNGGDGFGPGERLEIMDGRGEGKAASTVVLEEFLKRISPELLAQLEPGTRLVFADRPNSVQRPMPVNLGPATAKYLEIWRRMQRENAGYEQPDNVNFIGGLEVGRAAPASFARVLVAVSRLADGNNYVVQLKMLDANGQIVAQAMESFGVGAEENLEEAGGAGSTFAIEGRDAEFLNVVKNLPGNSDGGAPVNEFVMRAGSQEISFSSQDTWKKPTLPDGVLAFAMSPSEFEPLASYVSGALIGYAKAKGENLIAVPGDDLLTGLARRLKSGENQVSLLERELRKDYSIERKGGVTTVLPKDRFTQEAGYVSRKEIERVARLVSQRGFGRLQDRLDVLALKDSAPSRNDLGVTLLQMVDPGFAGSVVAIGGGRFVESRFLASLPPVSREDDGREYVTTVASLSTESKKWLEKLIFGRSSGPMVIGKGVAISISAGDEPSRTPPADVTEQYPFGVAGTATVLVRKQSVEAVLAESQGRSSRFFTAEALGMMRGLSEKMPNFQDQGSFEAYRQGRVLSLSLSVQLDEEQTLGHDTDFALAQSARRLAWNELSADFRRQVEEAMANSPQVIFGGNKTVKPPMF